MDNDKRHLNRIAIDQDTLSWLIDHANREGLLVGDFAGHVLDEAVTMWRPPTDAEPERLVHWQYLRMERMQRMRDQVYRAAAMYEKHPTEEMAEALARLCEIAEMDYGEVVREVRDDPFSSLLIHSRNGSVLGSCSRWLVDYLEKHDGEVPSRIMNIMAKREGYSKSTLKRAKNAVNDDDDIVFAVISRRDSDGWSWCLQEKEKKQVYRGTDNYN